VRLSGSRISPSCGAIMLYTSPLHERRRPVSSVIGHICYRRDLSCPKVHRQWARNRKKPILSAADAAAMPTTPSTANALPAVSAGEATADRMPGRRAIEGHEARPGHGGETVFPCDARWEFPFPILHVIFLHHSHFPVFQSVPPDVSVDSSPRVLSIHLP